MTINEQLAQELSLKLWQVEQAVKLLDEGNTVPFIARYRKEVTGELNDEVLRELEERLAYLRSMEERQNSARKNSPILMSQSAAQYRLREGFKILSPSL